MTEVIIETRTSDKRSVLISWWEDNLQKPDTKRKEQKSVRDTQGAVEDTRRAPVQATTTLQSER